MDAAERNSHGAEGPGGKSFVLALLNDPNISAPPCPPILQPFEPLRGSPPLTLEANAQFQVKVTKRGMFHPFLLVCTGAFQGSTPKSYS